MSNMSNNVVLEAHNLFYSYHKKNNNIPILKGVNFNIARQQRVGLVGASGVGKSTFLHLLGLLDIPQSGKIILRDGEQSINTHGLTDAQRTSLRSHLIGFVYQFHHLLNEFTALENVIIPQIIAGKSMKQAKNRAKDLLETVGLFNRLTHKPSQLSGGQLQRVAIARALANEPDILLADEPTGNLDSHTARDIFQLFVSLSQNHGLSMLMATHNPELRRQFDRVVFLEDGLLQEGDLNNLPM